MQLTNLALEYISRCNGTPTERLALKDEQRLCGITGTRAPVEFCIFCRMSINKQVVESLEHHYCRLESGEEDPTYVLGD